MFNGYETDELVQAHMRALLQDLEHAERVGDETVAKACRKQLTAFGHRIPKPADRAERRPRTAEAEKR